MSQLSRRRLLLYLLWPVFALIVLLASAPLWFPQLGNYLVVSDPLERSDVIVVLGGGDMQRYKVGAQLYKQKWAPHMLTLGNIVPDYIEALGEQLTFAELGTRILIAEGVPADSVTAINESTSTYEEAVVVKEYALKNKFRRVIVVTSIYHTRRARAVYRKVFKNSGIEVIMQPARGGKYRLERWWTREDDLIFVNNEWIKLILYKLQGKI